MEAVKPWILLFSILLLFSHIFILTTLAEGVTPQEAKLLRDELNVALGWGWGVGRLMMKFLRVRGMFYHAFDGYMENAFPLDELRPLTCEGEDTLGGYALTLIDSLDTLALLGDRERFATSVEWIGKNLRFDINKTVSVFETTIRILGGLLSGHLIASDYATGMKIPSYDNQLLHLCEDLARRLLPAFDTPTAELKPDLQLVFLSGKLGQQISACQLVKVTVGNGIPFGSVNLLHGVDEHESKAKPLCIFFPSYITSTAGGGTLTLEFGVLSRLTNDPTCDGHNPCGGWCHYPPVGPLHFTFLPVFNWNLA
ncbi:Alpha-mannosidase I MNS4 [Vitis vinifera]|uniref:alpha-1,2-Mannosidase n=1 Tax=Vitis vinifera TaxID=29760 RepID=A0A438F7C5_VITVI|nr:Alpha-mannosidase I MNS4 [Vitis vinifera]